MRTPLVTLATVLVVAGLVPASSPAQPSGGGVGLCGITPHIDVLLCSGSPPEPPSPPPAPPPPSLPPPLAPPADETAAPPAGDQRQAAAQAEPQPRVRKVSLIPSYVADQLLIRFAPRTSLKRQREVLKEAGVVVERRIGQIGVVVVRMPPERRDAALAKLQASASVADADKSAVVEALDTTPNDVAWPGQWGLRTIGLPKAWDRTRGSRSVIVAVLDTGVDATHPDLDSAVLSGWDLVNDDSDASDDGDHGTSVAGIIAARTNNLEGVAGVCWSCFILPVKVLDGEGRGDVSLIAAGIVRAVDEGARVINLSLGGPASDQVLEDAVAYAAEQGAFVVAATGNNGVMVPFYPAATPGAISVAATDELDHLYPWSNSGPWAALAAPGCNDTTQRGGGYGLFCGTSSATPVVSGLVALALSAQPSATRGEILAALGRATSPIGGAVSQGRIDAFATLAALGPAAPSVAPSPAPVTSAKATIRGSLTRRITSRTYPRAVGDGPIAATLKFTGAKPLTLTIRDQSGALVLRRTGGSPLRITRELKAGTLAIRISGRGRRTTFALTLSYRPPAAASAEAPAGPRK